MTPTLPLHPNEWPWPSVTRPFSVTIDDGMEPRVIVVWALTFQEARTSGKPEAKRSCSKYK